MSTEKLGPAERIINTLLAHTDHLYHGRPGIVTPDARTTIGVRWAPVTHKIEDGVKVIYGLTKVGKKTTQTKLGVLQPDGKVKDGNRVVGEFRNPGLFPEAVKWVYEQIVEVYKLDHEFVAKWASYAFAQEHRDLKMALAAFMLVQERKGDPVIENGKCVFRDEDYRNVGEAMLLLRPRDDKGLDTKFLLRIQQLLALPAIAEINRKMGFGKSAKNPTYGRWNKTVSKWLKHHEMNPKLLNDLVKKGYRTTVMSLASRVGYKPETPEFFQTLRWKQKQAADGRRQLAIGKEVKAAESFEGLSEAQICEKIMKTKPNFKRLVGMLPNGLTRAIVAAAIESGAMSEKDLIIATPTLEDLGLLTVEPVKSKWEKAVKNAEDMRASNIATRVKSKEVQDKLHEASDNALKKSVEKVIQDRRVYFFIDRSGSMEHCIEVAKKYLTKFLQGFPADKIHIATFNTTAKEVKIPHASAAGVENAFRGVTASGGTDYGAGVLALSNYKPTKDEESLFIFIGDEEATVFTHAVTRSGLKPTAFGFLKVSGDGRIGALSQYEAVRRTAQELNIPCFMINEETFSDPYAIPRTLQNLINSTPVSQVRVMEKPRQTLIDTILQTKLLQKPTWA